MGVVGGAAGMVGGELLGGHPIVGPLVGAYLGNRMDEKHRKKKRERDEEYF